MNMNKPNFKDLMMLVVFDLVLWFATYANFIVWLKFKGSHMDWFGVPVYVYTWSITGVIGAAVVSAGFTYIVIRYAIDLYKHRKNKKNSDYSIFN